MIKKINKRIASFMILLMLSVSLTGCSDNDTQTLKEKITNEISYLDLNLIEMLNKANGISLENYIVEAETVKNNETAKSGEASQQSSSSKQNSSKESSSNNSESNNGEKSDSEESNSKSSNDINYKMVGNEILLQDHTTDWKSLKSNIEKLYSNWETIILDLYKINVNNQDILNFSADLDIATSAIQNEDKIKTLNALAKLYSYIPTYTSAFIDNVKTSNLYKTKSHILTAYTLIEQNDFKKIEDELKKAENSLMPILNDIDSYSSNQSNINKSYILIKELENYNANMSKEIFYIKYKNLIQNLNNIKI